MTDLRPEKGASSEAALYLHNISIEVFDVPVQFDEDIPVLKIRNRSNPELNASRNVCIGTVDVEDSRVIGSQPGNLRDVAVIGKKAD